MKKSQFPVLLLPLTLLSVTILSGMLLVQSAYAFDSTKYEFSIDAPSGWTVQEQTEPVIVLFTDSYNTGATINVVVDDTPGARIEDVGTETINYLSSFFEDFELVDQGSRVVGRLNGYQIEYKVTQSGVAMRLSQVFFIENGKTYVITCSALDSVYILAYPDFERSIRSFQITSESQTVICLTILFFMSEQV